MSFAAGFSKHAPAVAARCRCCLRLAPPAFCCHKCSAALTDSLQCREVWHRVCGPQPAARHAAGCAQGAVQPPGLCYRHCELPLSVALLGLLAGRRSSLGRCCLQPALCISHAMHSACLRWRRAAGGCRAPSLVELPWHSPVVQDLFTEEEQRKREQRAARFGLPAGSGLEWKPPQVGGGHWRQAAGLPGLHAAWQHVPLQQTSTVLLPTAPADDNQEEWHGTAQVTHQLPTACLSL